MRSRDKCNTNPFKLDRVKPDRSCTPSEGRKNEDQVDSRAASKSVRQNWQRLEAALEEPDINRLWDRIDATIDEVTQQAKLLCRLTVAVDQVSGEILAIGREECEKTNSLGDRFVVIDIDDTRRSNPVPNPGEEKYSSDFSIHISADSIDPDLNAFKDYFQPQAVTVIDQTFLPLRKQ